MGCSKNRVDSEHLVAQLVVAGYEAEFDSNELDADVVVINTCGFIGDAKEESIDMILSAVEAKEDGLIGELYVIGCLSERYADELRNEIPDVDRYFGVSDMRKLVEQLGATYLAERECVRELSTPSHYAYLKISEGCNWRCGYCAIPLIRGRHISVAEELLIAEAEGLAAKGVRELIVVAQDTTYYGMDLYGERRLAQLLTKLCQIEGIEWIRLHYAYPTNFPQDVIEVMAREPKICSYLDIPFQHIADEQLSSMRRRHTKAEALELIEQLRSAIPDLVLRTTLLVGYPGESEENYRELLDFVTETKFERLGVFPYSEEEGTYSATLEDNVTQEIKEQRAERIMDIQREISLQKNIARIGRVERVIVDDYDGQYFITRSQYDSPEVDTEIFVKAEQHELEIGEFYDVKITQAEEFDLYAQILNR